MKYLQSNRAWQGTFNSIPPARPIKNIPFVKGFFIIVTICYNNKKHSPHNQIFLLLAVKCNDGRTGNTD